MTRSATSLSNGFATSFELTLTPRPKNVPAYQWLRNALRTEVLSGRLAPGAKVPASRELARQYGLARGTVLAALDELQSEGYLESRRGSGTYVSHILPEVRLQSPAPVVTASSSGQRRRVHLSAFAERVRPFSLNVRPESRAFRTNLPALDLFPTTVWAQVASRRLRAATARNLLGCESRGYRPLREAVARYAHSSRGVKCTADQVVIVSGVQEGLDLTARLLLDPGDRVLLEDPGYQGAYAIFAAMGAKVVAMPLDEQGAAPREADLRRCRLMYLTPGHQYPLGMTMSLARRLQLLAWAKRHGTTIFEDDYDSEFRFFGRPLPAMQGLDHADEVIFCGSFNKVLFPSLRLAYLVLPPALVEIFAAAKTITTRHHSLLDQAVLCDFIELGHFGRHLRRMRKIYEERYLVLMDAARQHLADHLELAEIEAGLQTIGWLHGGGLSAEQVASEAARAELDVVPLNRYCHRATLAEGLQIGFAAIDEPQIRMAVEKLAGVFDRLRSDSRRGVAAERSKPRPLG